MKKVLFFAFCLLFGMTASMAQTVSNHAAPGITQAEDFDATDTHTVQDAGRSDGPYVPTNANEAYNYTITAAEAGVYDIILTYSCEWDNRAVALHVNGTRVTSLIMPNTQDTQIYGELVFSDVSLDAGSNLLTFTPDQGQCHFDKFKIRKQGYAGTPYGELPVIPCTVQAENYDNGGEGVAYHDLEAGHQGGGTIALRPEENVEIESGPAGGYHVGWTNAGEWLNYTVEAPKGGLYNLLFSWACPDTEDRYITVAVDGFDAGTYTIPRSSSFDDYKEFIARNIPFSKGINVVTVKLERGNFDKVDIKDYLGSPYTGTAFNLPADIIEAELFDNGGADVAYYVAEAAGGADNVIRPEETISIRESEEAGQYIILKNKEWAAYSINVAQTEIYYSLFNCAGASAVGKLNIWVDDRILKSPEINAGAEWTYIEQKGVELTAGSHLLKIEYEGEGELYFGDAFFDILHEDLTPTLTYEFEDASDLTKPTIGDLSLEFYRGTGSGIGTPDPTVITQADGPTAGNKAAFIPADGRIKVLNPQGPAVTGERLGRFTVLFDYYIPDLEAGGGYHCLFSTDESNSSDGHMFIHRTGKIGKGGAYSAEGMAKAQQWQRLIVSFDGDMEKMFLDGEEILNRAVTNTTNFGDFFWIFTDNDGEDPDSYCARFYFWAGLAMTKPDIENAGLSGSPLAIKPVNAANGSVYASEGKLYFRGISPNASAEVYNLAGQKIAFRNKIGGRSIDLPQTGLFIVKVTDEGISKGYKVVNH